MTDEQANEVATRLAEAVLSSPHLRLPLPANATARVVTRSAAELWQDIRDSLPASEPGRHP